MTTKQWIGTIVVLALMVFGLTFAMNYVPSSRGGKSPQVPGEVPELTFAMPVAPAEGAPPLESELKHPGHYDFWFENRNDREVTLGMQSKTCRCTEADLYVMPEAAQAEATAMAAARVAVLAAPVPAGLGVGPLAAWQDSKLAKDLESVPGSKFMIEGQEPFKVPAHRIGWVRMRWSADRPENNVLKVHLWNEVRGGKLTELQAAIMVMPPMMVAKPVVDAGSMEIDKLPRNVEAIYLSPTRDELKVNIVVERVGRAPGSDPIVIGAPERLSKKECQELVRDSAVRVPEVRCAYRVPITLLPVAKDGKTPFDLGTFQRLLTFQLDDPADFNVNVTVTGRLAGDVQVGGESERGVIHFGPFNAHQGAFRQITLDSNVAGLELEVDPARLPMFVAPPQLSKPDVSGTGHRTWRLQVEVLPDKVSGRFPNPDIDAFRDSAIYLKMKAPGRAERTLRVPLEGTGNNS